MALTRDKILKHSGMHDTREVHIPAWADETGDDVVLVRGLTAREWDSHQIAVADVKAGHASNASAELIVRCLVNPDGTRLLTDADAAAVGELSVGDITKLGAAILELSGLTELGREAVEGNSEAAPSGSSDSGSPETSDAPSPNLSIA